MRLTAMIDALRSEGEVDLLCTARVREPSPDAPDDVRVLSLAGQHCSGVRKLLAWLRSDLPRSQLGSDFVAADSATREWLAERYDLLYLSHLWSWIRHGDVVEAPTIVDLDNLDNLVIRAARSVRPPLSDPKALARWAMMWPVEWIDERRTERMQRRCAADVERVTVCSSLDRERSGFANAVVIANGYERAVEPPVERSGTVLLFIGRLTYPPNSDGVTWFARKVLPLVRNAVPAATFRVIGGGIESVRGIEKIPGVELVGPVDDIQPELDAACASVVPIRFGSGTRLKVIEALANRLPLVATPLGAEGTNVEDGVHGLLASDPAAFAESCVAVLRDDDLRRRLVEEGERLWSERFRWSRIQAEMATLARQVAGV